MEVVHPIEPELNSGCSFLTKYIGSATERDLRMECKRTLPFSPLAFGRDSVHDTMLTQNLTLLKDIRPHY